MTCLLLCSVKHNATKHPNVYCSEILKLKIFVIVNSHVIRQLVWYCSITHIHILYFQFIYYTVLESGHKIVYYSLLEIGHDMLYYPVSDIARKMLYYPVLEIHVEHKMQHYAVLEIGHKMLCYPVLEIGHKMLYYLVLEVHVGNKNIVVYMLLYCFLHKSPFS